MTGGVFYLGIVPARAGSKRIPGKNMIELKGQPLINFTFNAARASRQLDAVVVSTDSAAIAEHARAEGFSVPALRPAEIAGDRSPIVDALVHALSIFEVDGPHVDAVVLLQPTSPFRTAKHIDHAIELFERSGADTVTAVCASRDHPYWCWRGMPESITPYYSIAEIAMDRNDLPRSYSENGAVYVIRRENIIAGRIYGPHVAAYEMDEISSVDIDTPIDLAWAEFLIDQGMVSGV